MDFEEGSLNLSLNILVLSYRKEENSTLAFAPRKLSLYLLIGSKNERIIVRETKPLRVPWIPAIGFILPFPL